MIRRTLGFAGMLIALAMAAAVAIVPLSRPEPPPAARQAGPVARVAAASRAAVLAIFVRQGDGPEEFSGTGFVAGANGLVITCRHVVEGADSLSAQTADGKRLSLTLVYADPAGDLALLWLPEGRYHALALAESTPAVGDEVVAVGAPLGQYDTVTAGVVSHVGRGVDYGFGLIPGLIQHSAAAAPGSSGCPVLDLEGRVVGVHCAGVPRTTGFGMAIPAAAVRRLLSRFDH